MTIRSAGLNVASLRTQMALCVEGDVVQLVEGVAYDLMQYGDGSHMDMYVGGAGATVIGAPGAVIKGMYFYGQGVWTFENVSFQYFYLNATIRYAAYVSALEKIVFDGCAFSADWGADDAKVRWMGTKGQAGAFIRNCGEVVITDCDFGYLGSGLVTWGNGKLTVVDNQFHHLGGDAIQAHNDQDWSFERNFVTSLTPGFEGAGSRIHFDAAQCTTDDATEPMFNTRIVDNLFYRGSGDAGANLQLGDEADRWQGVAWTAIYRGYVDPLMAGNFFGAGGRFQIGGGVRPIIRDNCFASPMPGDEWSRPVVGHCEYGEIYGNVGPGFNSLVSYPVQGRAPSIHDNTVIASLGTGGSYQDGFDWWNARASLRPPTPAIPATADLATWTPTWRPELVRATPTLHYHPDALTWFLRKGGRDAEKAIEKASLTIQALEGAGLWSKVKQFAGAPLREQGPTLKDWSPNHIDATLTGSPLPTFSKGYDTYKTGSTTVLVSTGSCTCIATGTGGFTIDPNLNGIDFGIADLTGLKTSKATYGGKLVGWLVSVGMTEAEQHTFWDIVKLNFYDPMGLPIDPVAIEPDIEPETVALAARHTVAPAPTRFSDMDAVFKALKAAGIKIGSGAAGEPVLLTLQWEAAADAQASKLNWMQATGNLTTVNAPVFTVDRGYQGDGVSAHLNLGVSTSVWEAGGGMFGYWADIAGGGYPVGTSRSRLSASSGKLQGATTDLATPGLAGAGFHAIVRNSDGKERIFGPTGTKAAERASGSDANHAVLTGLRANTAYSTARLAATFVGNGQWSEAQVQALRDALAAYATALGVAGA